MEDLCLVVQGQQERNILNSSMRDYLRRCRTMTRLINDIEGLREVALDIDETGVARKRTGLAKDILKLKLPMAVQTRSNEQEVYDYAYTHKLLHNLYDVYLNDRLQ
mmetsp:Transcript_18796/g.27155  ORF Transcript_18796/g.27155 Transcript_18796/m.27155 type:complete len:106 (+) Transcript_18796:86-403(+)